MPCVARGGFVFFIAADVKQAAVDFGMQRFDAAIHHFGKAGVCADVADREARSRKALAVPPVEMISMPAADKARAKGISPVLSKRKSARVEFLP